LKAVTIALTVTANKIVNPSTKAISLGKVFNTYSIIIDAMAAQINIFKVKSDNAYNSNFEKEGGVLLAI
jgi:hypothetical protein